MDALVNKLTLELARPFDGPLEECLAHIAFDIHAKLLTLERDARLLDPEFTLDDTLADEITAQICSNIYDMYPQPCNFKPLIFNIHELTVLEATHTLIILYQQQSNPLLRYAKSPIRHALQQYY